jgi:xylan 1,4-beta-xylosidase
LKNGNARLTQYRIDGDHSNAYAAWLGMGSPSALNATQYAQLEKAGQLAELAPAETIRVEKGQARVRFDLPRQGVALLVVDWN